MKWLLVVIIMNSPIRTDLTFDTLNACLLAEQDMRAQWIDTYNAALKRGAAKETLDLVKSQMSTGTCIPAKR